MLTETFSPRVVDLYFLGFLITTNLLAAWFHSNFPQHLWNLTHPLGEKVYTKDDLMEQAITTYGSFGDLWVCPICLGTWMSLLVSFFMCHELPFPPGSVWFHFTLTAMFTWPVGFYAIHKFLSK
jgi:hypothetical protein